MKRMLVAALAVALFAGAAEAQRPVKFAVGGGLSGVAGDAKQSVDAGYHVMGAVDVGVPILPLGFRVDAAYNSFKGKEELTAGVVPSLRVVSGTANVTMNVIPLPIVKMYLIGGAGIYNAKADVDGAEATNRFGYNAGAGLRFDLAGFGTFLEARYHLVPESDTDAKMQIIPVTLGFRF
ncbi:MAG: outer membrane beta-barrel protein [Gemmatimonadaceae bacterium]